MEVKVLVTGANGQLGKTLSDLVQDNQDDISFTFVSRAQLDISKKQQLRDYFHANSFDYCINCAAYTNVEQAEESIEEAFLINAEAVGYLAESCKQNDTILIHISTDYVFDGRKSVPYLESDPTNPVNQYGKSKLSGEKKIQTIWSNYFIIRTSWLYSKYPKNFVTTIASKIRENTDLTITTSQKGTPTSCVELSKFMYWLIKNQNKDFGIYHFSAKGEATWYDFALRIAKAFSTYDSQKIAAVATFNSKAERPGYSVMDNSKAQKIYPHQNHWSKDVDNVLKEIL
ncbi:MAG TPA: dTDP-4-dehydrorhamnose reductase [Aquaticitalea sp.]|nr:dTDP-4-dehydrorhamnose reductase [Aquaticitalea sp.]